jgi:hypothetical protein
VTEDEELLDTENYTLFGNQILIRKNATWGEYVTIVYTALNDAGLLARQRMVVVQLIKLWLAFNGYSSVGGPDINITSVDYVTERKKILSTLIDEWIFA